MEEVRLTVAEYCALNLPLGCISQVQESSSSMLSKLQTDSSFTFGAECDKPRWNCESNGVFSSLSGHRWQTGGSFLVLCNSLYSCGRLGVAVLKLVWYLLLEACSLILIATFVRVLWNRTYTNSVVVGCGWNLSQL